MNIQNIRGRLTEERCPWPIHTHAKQITHTEREKLTNTQACKVKFHRETDRQTGSSQYIHAMHARTQTQGERETYRETGANIQASKLNLLTHMHT